MKKRRGFTLIELLAVIVILGLLMAIAIPSVTKYITQSRKKTLTNTIGNYMGALVNEVNDMVYTFTGTNTIYAVPIECIAVERGGTNPFGKWYQANNSYWAYVLVQYDDQTSSYKYGFTFKDSAGYGLYPTTQAKINEKGSQIVIGLNLSRPKNGLVTEITPLSNWTGFDVDSTTKLKVLTAGSEDQVGDGVNTCTLVQKGDNYAQVEEEKNSGGGSVTPPVENPPVVEPPEEKFAFETIKEKVNGTTLIHHNTIGAKDGSYRYSGINPNNYVCFGSDLETCPESNLYRIIGVFGENLKLIKASKLTSAYWNGANDKVENAIVVNNNGTSYYNHWGIGDTKTTLNTALNGSLFFDKLPIKWQNMIVSFQWPIGAANVTFSSFKARDFYNFESSEKWFGKVAMMTVSEYGYAASFEYWDTYIVNYSEEAADNDWLNISEIEWFLTRTTDTYTSFYLSSDGTLYRRPVYWYTWRVRPSFYLDSNVKIIAGEGTSSNPYRLSM